MTSPRLLSRVGPYRVLVPLGAGGLETALAAEDGPGGFRQVVRVEVARTRRPGFEAHAEDLARQAACGVRLDDPHVLRVLRFFADPEGHVLVLEYPGGATLAELLDAARASGERWSDDAVLQIGAAACRALAYARTQVDGSGRRVPIAHGALDAGSVHLGRDGSIKISGFGRLEVAESVDRAAAGKLLWQLLARRGSKTEGEHLATVRYDLPPEVSAVIEAARAPGSGAIGVAQLAAWLDKASRGGRAREEIARRVSAHVAVQQAMLLRAPRAVDASANAFLRRPLRYAARAGAAVAVACAAFAAGRVSGLAGRGAADASLSAEEPTSSVDQPPPALSATAPTNQPDAQAEVPAQASDDPQHTALASARPSGFGWLTVHSPMRSGYVYLHLRRSGHVEQRIPVACGKRFVSLGLPNQKGHEPTWLAPSQYVSVPCGGEAETTIAPRSAKRRGR